jgi:anti-sigma factor RsiW
MTNSDKTLVEPDLALLTHAYVDGELDLANALSVKQQIDTNPTLAAEAARASALKKVLRERFPLEVPDGLRERIDAAVGRPARWNRPTWGALAASLLIAVALSSAGTRFALQAPSTDRVSDDAVSSHIRALISPKPYDVASSERHVVKPWFNGRIPQSPRVIDLAPEGFPLVGARIDVIKSIPVPTLVYMRRMHLISLSAVSADSRDEPQLIRRSINGYNVVSWSRDGITYVAASDLNAGELEQFARRFRDAPSG